MSDSKEIRHAVIITDDKDNYLRELSDSSPFCLTALANVPIIHYLILNLLRAKITNFTIFCGKHKKTIRKFIKEVRYEDYSKQNVKFEFNGDENLITVGDTIRYLDEKKFEKEFILVHGDLLIDCDFSELMNLYRESRQMNKQRNRTQIMATVATATQHASSKPYDWLMIDKDNNIVAKDGIKMSDSYSDPQVYICSEMVPARMQDNQDCTSIYDLIDSVLAVSEAVNDVVQVIECPPQYTCMRLATLDAYLYATTRVIRCSVLGCSPPRIFGDNIRTVPSSESPIISSHHSTYLCSSLDNKFADSSTRMVGNVSVMSGTVIGKNCRIIDSMIGRNCRIGDGVILKRCVLLDGVVIGDGCLLSEALVGAAVEIGNRCQVTVGAVVKESKVIAMGTRLQGDTAGQRIASDRVVKDVCHDDDAYDSDEEDEDDSFQSILHDLLRSAIDDDESIDSLYLEVRKVQMDLDRDTDDSLMGLTVAVTMYPIREPSDEKYGVRVKALFKRFAPLINRFVRGEESKRRMMLEAVEECACGNSVVMEKAADLVFSMYKYDLVEDVDIRLWWKSSALLQDEEALEATAQFRTNLKGFMDFLDTVSDSDESDQSDESED